MYVVINELIGFTQYMLFIQSNESGLFESGLFENSYFTTDVYNALQIILVFLIDVPKLPHQKKMSKHSGYKTFVL